jgi:predicted metalloendopeptidase
MGGLKIAYCSLKKVLVQHPDVATKNLDGFTREHRFFLAYAQVWRANQRDAETRRRLVIDPHSPPQYRCNGPLSNMPEFAKAFNLPKDSPMVRPPDQRVNIW